MYVVLYELFTYGREPFPDMNNSQTMEQVIKGYKMAKPSLCPEDIYAIMLRCWSQQPNDRPSFDELYDQLNVYYDATKDSLPLPSSSTSTSTSTSNTKEKEVGSRSSVNTNYNNLNNNYNNQGEEGGWKRTQVSAKDTSSTDNNDALYG